MSQPEGRAPRFCSTPANAPGYDMKTSTTLGSNCVAEQRLISPPGVGKAGNCFAIRPVADHGARESAIVKMRAPSGSHDCRLTDHASLDWHLHETHPARDRQDIPSSRDSHQRFGGLRHVFGISTDCLFSREGNIRCYLFRRLERAAVTGGDVFRWTIWGANRQGI